MRFEITTIHCSSDTSSVDMDNTDYTIKQTVETIAQDLIIHSCQSDVESTTDTCMNESLIGVPGVPHKTGSVPHECLSACITSGVEGRFVSCMVLSAVADAMGFHNGEYEFHRSGPQIHQNLNEGFGGLDQLTIKCELLVI